MYRTILIALILLTPLLSLGQIRAVPHSQTLKPSSTPKLFRPLLAQIKRNTKIPILLPSMLPSKWKNYRLFSYSESEPNLWKIVVGTEPDCGANACSVGYLEAKRGEEPPKPDEVDIVVKLAKGMKGYYTGKSCGGSCTPPQIDWVYGGVLYTIQFRVEGKSQQSDAAVIVEMANSAILAGAR